MVCACLITVLLFLYMVFDVHYFLRIFFTIITGKLFQKKIKLFDTTTIYGICLTQDVDLFLKHMNNARYLRELDFARFHFYDRSGLYAAILKRGGGAVQGASSIRYRRAIPIFSPYKVTTKLLYWEGKNFYIENQFITLSDNFVRAVILSKQTSTGIQASMAEIVADVDPNARLPELSKDLELWINSMEISSKKFRKQE
ncbi:protein THEM6 [Megachile rotundata]|uniref:protein THEM6 n=1 Tax=Megachile rotundata TaxID=143995 RepID=UPI003FCFE131